jgi:repressor LexA
LNERAREILAFMDRFRESNGFPPTIREIGAQFGIRSTNGVRYYLNLLEQEGHIARTRKVSRAIVLAKPARRATGIPIVGRVAAGQPILAEENVEGSLSTDELFGARGGSTDELFALKVRGDSMIDAGILDGDYVVVRSRERASSGEMVVALIGDEATVKFYRPAGDHAELVPANPNYQPIRVGHGDDFRIAGVVTGVLRTVGRSAR